MSTDDIIAKARKAYPAAATDTEALVLAVSRLEYHRSERLDALNMNAWQASRIAVLSARLAEQAVEIDALRREVGR